MDDASATTTVAVDPRQVGYTHLMYALHAASIAIGLLGTRYVVTAFVFGAPSIVAVIMNYARRDKVRDTWLGSHFRWQLRSFWIALAAVVVVSLAFGPFKLLFISWPLQLAYVVIGAWALYRIIRGWIALNNHCPMTP